MEPLSKYNSTTLIRHANSKLDLRCRSSDSSAAELQLMHCISSRDCRNLTEVESLGSQVRVRFQSLQANDSGTYICLDHNTTEETDLVSCPNQTITNTSITCHWSCDNGRKYHVYLHGWNQLGNVSRIYNISPENYAMLSIQKLELVPSNISMSIVVQLHEHVFLSRVGKIVFQIEKRVLQDSESELTNLTQWITEIQENYEKNITDLKPFTRYEICIQTRLFEAIGHWSKPVCGKTVTKEGVPTHAPETTKWAYYFEKGSGRVRLYLKKIPSKYNTSKNYNYSILRLESGQVTSNITTKPNTTIEIPSNWIKGNDKITVRIRSCNDIGCSDPSTYVNIHKAKAGKLHQVTQDISYV
ncbi:uncharacterized protein LOC133184485 [Saccostrea echinata]|uniref:uncharacterized protein LOC133184485 n=1 Tax=Saccostrea echinata TaxID=191078 RepID=UPI002A83A632|nr:uncharacterized protein LOC133184485 [Saccostrea echinata]